MATYLVGHVEILIHFHSFINVDLFHQGTYQIRCHAYTRPDDGQSGGPGEVIAATPLKLWQRDSEGSISEKDKSYSTKSFSIQYCDEEVDLAEGIVLGAEINIVDPRPQYAYVEFTLWFAEQDTPTDFSEAAYQVIQIRNPHYGMASHLKLTFDSFHFSTTTLTVVTAMTEIKRGVHRREPSRTAPTLPVRAFIPKSPPSLKYITKQIKSSQRSSAANVESKFNAVYDPDRNVAMTLQTDSPTYVDEHSRVAVEVDGYRPPRPGCWSEPTFHDFLCYFESCSKPITAPTSQPGQLTDIGKLMKDRVDNVGRRFHQLLLRNYYFLAALCHTLVTRVMNESDLKQFTWISSNPPLRIPGGYTLLCGANGLPDSSTLRAGRSYPHQDSCVKIYLKECFIASRERDFLQSDEDVSSPTTADSQLRRPPLRRAVPKVSNSREQPESSVSIKPDEYCNLIATAHVTSYENRAVEFEVPYRPISTRPRIRDNKKTLISDLQLILTDDINVFWCQISEKWHKLGMILSLAHRESSFFFELLQNDSENRRIGALFRREVITHGISHIQGDPGQYHSSLAEEYRRSKYQQEWGSGLGQSNPVSVRSGRSAHTPLSYHPAEKLCLDSVVEDCHENPDLRSVPIIFEEIYANRQTHLQPQSLSVEKWPPLTSSADSASGSPSSGRYGDRQTSGEQWFQDTIPTERSTHGDYKGQVASVFEPNNGKGLVSNALNNSLIRYRNREWSSHLDPKPYEGLHLIVLVHGFRGNSFDLRTFRNYLQRLYPEHIYLLSSCNENKSDDDIFLQSQRLCHEIIKYVSELCTWDNIGRISFISHSLGGLITRSCVPLLLSALSTNAAGSEPPIESKLWLYMSLSTPHLGYTAARNKFVDAGIWLLKKLKKSQCLSQLCMCDSSKDDYKDSFLYKLSRNNALNKFSKIMLISSPQDNYVPYESARIEFSKRNLNNHTWSRIHQDLIQNIFKNIRQFVRLDVSFEIESKNLDSIIGRTAHINFLSSEYLAYIITTRYASAFQ